jgi:hypothetical protein
MNLNDRIELLSRLGDYLQSGDEHLEALIQRTAYHNPWFTTEHQHKALTSIATQMLQRNKLQNWLQRYAIPDAPNPARRVALVLAGNIPLVGFHDLLCVFVSGHRAIVKLSDKDPYVLPHLLQWMERQMPEFKGCVELSEQLRDMDAVIATGSNNSARYFEAYFGRYPNIIRRNRNGVAVLRGDETPGQLLALGQDVFQYFGLGCRNVSKLYVPRGYEFNPLLEAMHEYREIVLHSKYKNNFDYNYALFLLNKQEFLANGCIMLLEDASFQSRISTVHYEYYEDPASLPALLDAHRDQIQCVVAAPGLLPDALPFGKTQEPELWDYADGVDTLDFLIHLQ